MARQSLTRVEFLEIVAFCRSGQEVRVVIRRADAGGSGAYCVYLSIGDRVELVALCGGLSLSAAQVEAALFNKWLAEAGREEA